MIKSTNSVELKNNDEPFEFGSQYTGNYISVRELKKKLVSKSYKDQKFPPYVPFYRTELRVFD